MHNTSISIAFVASTQALAYQTNFISSRSNEIKVQACECKAKSLLFDSSCCWYTQYNMSVVDHLVGCVVVVVMMMVQQRPCTALAGVWPANRRI
jgi:hypothetical protein